MHLVYFWLLGHFAEDTLRRTLCGVHFAKDTLRRTLCGGHVAEDTLQRTLCGGHFAEDTCEGHFAEDTLKDSTGCGARCARFLVPCTSGRALWVCHSVRVAEAVLEVAASDEKHGMRPV